MGKYIRKAEVRGDVAVMEVPQSTTLGVRTRAKTLALQRQQSSSATASKPDSCYLELRSRRLEKSPLLAEPKKPSQKAKQSCYLEGQKSYGSSKTRNGSTALNSGSLGSGSVSRPELLEVADKVDHDVLDLGLEAEASFGENNWDNEPRESRSTRESTPCSFIGDVDASTPGSSTRRQSSDARNQRPRSGILRNMPSTHEMEEFFAHAERQQELLFIEKYNFNFRTELPLPGRYEWVKVSH